MQILAHQVSTTDDGDDVGNNHMWCLCTGNVIGVCGVETEFRETGAHGKNTIQKWYMA